MCTTANNKKETGVTKVMLLHNNNTGRVGERLLPYKIKDALFKKKGIPYYLYLQDDKDHGFMTEVYYNVPVDEAEKYREMGRTIIDTTVYHGRSVCNRPNKYLSEKVEQAIDTRLWCESMDVNNMIRDMSRIELVELIDLNELPFPFYNNIQVVEVPTEELSNLKIYSAVVAGNEVERLEQPHRRFSISDGEYLEDEGRDIF